MPVLRLCAEKNEVRKEFVLTLNVPISSGQLTHQETPTKVYVGEFGVRRLTFGTRDEVKMDSVVR